ncbi:ERF family protein [Clostridium baratii]
MSGEEKKLTIDEKMQIAKVELQKKDLKKSGFNKYSNYKYFELRDFLPHINEICLKVRLGTEFQYTEDLAVLIIKDLDNPQEVLKCHTPVKVPVLKGCNEMQAIGASQTFARKQLYTMAFDIAETDAIDAGATDEDAEEAKRKINKASVMTINKLIDETGTDKKKFLSWTGVSKVEDITNEALATCLKMLEKKKNDIKIKRQQEEHQKELEQHQEDFDF